MQIGNINIELAWPGLFNAAPAILLFIVMPCFLVFALFRYSSASQFRKIAYTPLCILGPFLISGLIPLLLAISGFIVVSNSGVFERYVALSTIFGDHSNYVWTFLTGFVVYGIYNHLRKSHRKKEDTLKQIRIHYLDASAIVKLVLNENGSSELRRYFSQESNFTVTSLCFMEALGVLKVKRFNRECISDDKYFGDCDELMARVSGGYIEIEDIEIKDRSVFGEVENLTRKYNNGKPKDKTIDISDAFQIVSVKRNYFSRFENSESKPILITADSPLADAARTEGLRVWYCINEPSPARGTPNSADPKDRAAD